MQHPITSTLFRFVNFRNPELRDETKTDDDHVTQSTDTKKGTFYDAINGNTSNKSKQQILWEAAQQFTSPFESATDVKALNPNLYDFSVWLVRNRTTYTITELQAALATVTQGLSTANKTSIWNNLFYQIFTQKSFYVKEAVMQMLLADHAFGLINKDLEKNTEYNYRVINSRVVLPGELFNDYTKIPNIDSAPDSQQHFLPTGALKSALEVEAAKFRKKSNALLGKELEKSERLYRKKYNEAYSESYKNYEKAIKPKLDDYYKALEDARVAFIGNGIAYDPKNPYLKPAYVAYPEIQDFSFSFEAEISKNKIEAELSPAGYDTLLGVLGYDFEKGTTEDIDNLFKEFNTYKSLYAAIKDTTVLARQRVITNKASTQRKVNIAGKTVAAEDPRTKNAHTYYICNNRVDSSYIFYLSYSLPDESWQLLSIKVTISYPNETVEETTFVPPTINYNGSGFSLPDFYIFPRFQYSGDDAPTLEFELKFTNGSTRRIPYINAYQTEFCTLAIATGTDPVPEEPSGDTSPFIPKGFGITQLGVADYLKVEQTVQCYVEGEVSHIENVMAREYKERATRNLRRSEQTTTLSSEEEREKLRDSTTTDRYELQSEISKIISQSKDLAGSVNAAYGGGGATGFSISTNLSYATNTAQEDSRSQAQTKAQEITEHAMDRVVSKIKEERITKILEEYEENNKHGFDNRQGTQHVVGVYRWVDKLYKNQIWNYGKRMMLEFMIPEPSTFHVLGMSENQGLAPGSYPLKPEDPRTQDDEDLRLDTFKAITNNEDGEDIVAYWAGQYNVEIEPRPENQISIGESFYIKWDGAARLKDVEANSGNGKITIPEGYKAIRATAVFNAVSDNVPGGGRLLSITVGNKTATYQKQFPAKSMPLNSDTIGTDQNGELYRPEVTDNFEFGPHYTTEIPVSYTLGNHVSGDISVTVTCTATDAFLNAWKLRTFKAIIEAYEEALAAYNEKISAIKAAAIQEKATNPGFYRQIENTVLRKNCLSYLIDQNVNAAFSYGKDMTKATPNGQESFSTYEIDLSKGIDKYAASIKFLEQAFEWDIMSYYFYPFYWGRKSKWASLYQFDGSDDPTFRSFMQAGMARVVVTVRPGFEKAVAFYMATGLAWNGGSVPEPSDPQYVSITDEITKKNIDGPTKEGLAWITRVPTSLTILQADTIGLKVEKALPCNCGEASEFEEGTVIPCDSNFQITNSQIGQSQGQKIRFSFVDLERYGISQKYTVGFFDQEGLFPRIYECMGQTITIDRDATWQSNDSVKVVYDKLAAQLSMINGISAEQKSINKGFTSPDGIEFTVDTSVNPDFVFTKKNSTGGFNPEYDTLRVINSNGSVRVIYSDRYAPTRIQDKSGVPLQPNEVDLLLSMVRFSV